MDGQERGATGACGLCGQVPEEGKTFSHCARCKVVAYCSRACQVNHWKGGHKKECCAPPEAQEPVKALTKTKGGAAEEPEGSQPGITSVDDELSKPVSKLPSKPSSTPGNNSSSAGGASAAAEEEQPEKLLRRTVARVDAEGKQLSFGEHDDCTICLDTLRHAIKLPCGHWFCKECIEGLRQARSVQDLCPTCREPLPPGAGFWFFRVLVVFGQSCCIAFI